MVKKDSITDKTLLFPIELACPYFLKGKAPFMFSCIIERYLIGTHEGHIYKTRLP